VSDTPKYEPCYGWKRRRRRTKARSNHWDGRRVRMSRRFTSGSRNVDHLVSYLPVSEKIAKTGTTLLAGCDVAFPITGFRPKGNAKGNAH
jgi:hypothetical protein